MTDQPSHGGITGQEAAAVLRELREAATPGPTRPEGPIEDPVPWMLAAHNNTIAHGDSDPEGAWIVATSETEDGKIIAYCGNGPKARHNAALLSFIWNNLDEIERAMEGMDA